MIPTNRQPTHPGEILLEEFLKPMGVSQVEFANNINVPIQRINTIINGKRGITAETAILVSKQLNTTPEFWMNLQTAYDLYTAKHKLNKLAA